jgi:hypothetical protein
MAEIWNAFLEDYRDEVFDWSLRLTLEVFWEYCQDGNKAVAEFFRRRNLKLVQPQEREIKLRGEIDNDS